MRNRRRIVLPLVLILGIAFLAWHYGLDLHPPGRAPSPPAAARPGADLFSGVIQADEVQLSAEFGGRVAEVTVEEGAAVQPGQVLVRLDTTLIDDQVAVAEAQLSVAQAGLAHLQAGARPGAVAVARAQEAQAVAARNAARLALADAQALLNDPQDLALQVAVARAQLAAAEARVEQAARMRDVAQVAADGLAYAQQVIRDWKYPRVPVPGQPGATVRLGPPGIPLKLEEAPYDLWQAWAQLNAAVAARDGAREELAQLEAQRAAPQALIAQADAAAATLAQAEAAVQAAQAQTAALAAGPTAEQVAAAEARVAQASAALQALRLQRRRMAIASPLAGTVLVRQAEPGETAAPGAPLITLGGLERVLLVLYLPEQDLGRVHLGQSVRVSVDSYPGRVFAGQVTHIADRAEFTPRNVATREERVNTYYAIQVRLDNPDGALKPGMPADATLEEQ